MRKLATIALLLAASLFTVACTDAETETELDDVASIDEPSDLAVGPELDALRQRGLQPGLADLLDDNARPAHAPAAEDGGDRFDDGSRGDRAPAEPGTGVAECRTSPKVGADQPVAGLASAELGVRARARFDMMRKMNLVK